MKNLVKVIILSLFVNSFSALAMFQGNKVQPETRDVIIEIFEEIKNTNLCDLPGNVLMEVFSFLKQEDKAGLAIVGKELRRIWLYDLIINKENKRFFLKIEDDLFDTEKTEKDEYKKRITFIKNFKETLQDCVEFDKQGRELKIFAGYLNFDEQVEVGNKEFERRFKNFLKKMDYRATLESKPILDFVFQDILESNNVATKKLLELLFRKNATFSSKAIELRKCFMKTSVEEKTIHEKIEMAKKIVGMQAVLLQKVKSWDVRLRKASRVIDDIVPPCPCVKTRRMGILNFCHGVCGLGCLSILDNGVKGRCSILEYEKELLGTRMNPGPYEMSRLRCFQYEECICTGPIAIAPIVISLITWIIFFVVRFT